MLSWREYETITFERFTFGEEHIWLFMIEDQRYWINEFLKVCDEQKPDAVMVAGDVYDRATPGAAAITLLDYFIEEISNRQIPLLIIAGNHDSGERLEYAGEILKSMMYT